MNLADALTKCLDDLKDLRHLIKSHKPEQVARADLRRKATQLSTAWLKDLAQQVETSGLIDNETRNRYSDLFRQLLKLSSPNNRRKRYLEVLQAITKSFRNELILPLYERPSVTASLGLLTTLFKGLPTEEDAYLKEAVGCALKGFLRASVVLGWCAAIDRIHRKIEEIGFAVFNITSAQMASQQKGRFKKFNQVQNVGSVGDLREVFDNIVLWIVEGMGLIDANQHTRLRSCFDMRCQSAHPGEAPITEYNLLSFYSDLKEIVFDNLKFRLSARQAPTIKVPTRGSTRTRSPRRASRR